MFTYNAYYKGRKCEVQALRSYDAQEKAAKIFKAKKSYDVTVVLAAKENGTPVIHSTAEF